MAVQPLVQLKPEEFSSRDTLLRRPSRVVVDFGPHLQGLITDLIDTLLTHRIAIGLAAPQIGVDLRVVVINISEEKREPTWVLVNPRITAMQGKKDKKRESCMSVPNYGGEVERRSTVSLSYQDPSGAEVSRDVSGFLARVVCHEVDHLEGFLYLDRMKAGVKLEAVDIFKND